MAWWAGNRQARGALRPRTAAAPNRLPAAKVLCIQWARMAPRKLASGRADKCDSRSDPQHMRARRAERPARAGLRSALRDTVSDDAEDDDQRERHGRENAKQYGEESLTAILCVALDGFVEGEDIVGDLPACAARLLAAQRGYGVDSNCTAGRNHAGQCRNRNQNEGHREDYNRISCSALDPAGNQAIQT